MSVFSDSLMLMASTSLSAPPGEIIVDAASNNVEWTVPEGVYFIHVVCIGGGGGGSMSNSGGGGGGGGGGGLTYKNFIPVTPGEVLTLRAGTGGAGATTTAGGTGGNPSTIRRGAAVLVQALGGAGGVGPTSYSGGVGGQGGVAAGGDGGATGRTGSGGTASERGYGGGTGKYDGTSQPVGASMNFGWGTDVFGSNTGVATGQYGGGGAGGRSGSFASVTGRNGRVRVIWGAGKSYPNNVVIP